MLENELSEEILCQLEKGDESTELAVLSVNYRPSVLVTQGILPCSHVNRYPEEWRDLRHPHRYCVCACSSL